MKLVALGEGTYSVAEVCRILRPGMTPRKVHYWLDTGLLSEPVAWGSRGRPTLLSYRQLLEVRTVQHLRDELEFSLPRIREAVEWILDHLFAPEWSDLRYARGQGGHLVATTRDGQMTVPGGQGVLAGTLEDLNHRMHETREAWTSRQFSVPGHPHIVANTHVLGGAPSVRGTRLDTALLAAFVEGDRFTESDVLALQRLYPYVEPPAIADALAFEGLVAA